MKFHFEVIVTPFDFFRMSMKKTYKSPVGMCNIVFTVAAILLTLKFYAAANDIVQLLLVIMCLIFPVFQPLGVYFRGKSQVMSIPKGLTLDVDDTGVLVTLNAQSEKIRWSRVKALIDTGDMLILKVDNNNGYFLTKKVLRAERESFKAFVESKIERH